MNTCVNCKCNSKWLYIYRAAIVISILGLFYIHTMECI